MATPTDPKRSKRYHSEDDSESENEKTKTTIWPRFLIIESAIKDKPLKINPFLLSKTIQSIAGTVKSIKKLRSGSLLIECANEQQSKNLLKTNSLATIPVQVSPHRTLNYCKGILRDRSGYFADMTELELTTALRPQGISTVKRFTYKRNGETLPSNTYLINFSLPKPPSSIKAGYFNLPIETFIPSPLRCFKCQKFGHGLSSCRGQVTCAHCGERSHTTEDCTAVTKRCINCGGEHSASSRECPQWQKQVDINRVKYTQNISFPEAAKIVEGRTTAAKTYSQATKIANTRKPTYKSVAVQTSLTWNSDDDKFKQVTVREVATHIGTMTVPLLTTPPIKPSISNTANTKKSNSNRGKSNSRKKQSQNNGVEVNNKFENLSLDTEEHMEMGNLSPQKTTFSKRGKRAQSLDRALSPVKPP